MVGNGMSFSTRGLKVLFQSQRAGIDAQLVSQLVDFIATTQNSLDCAIYDLRHPQVLKALADIKANGKQLRIAYDGGKMRAGGLSADPKPSGTEQALRDAGLRDVATPIHEGRQLMHDKFLVRDGQAVWTGSANFTVGGLELQDNNCLSIATPELAQRYQTVFEDLIGGTHTHGRGRHRTVQPVPATGIEMPQVTLMPFFSPQSAEGIEDAIVAELQEATRVRVLAFLISDPGILTALERFGNDPNLDILGVYDPNGMHDVRRYTRQDPASFWFLQDPRFVPAPSHPFNPRREQDFMHNKAMIIDDHLVITGSYNFSENAEANDENILLIDSRAVAAAYTTYFNRLFDAYAAPTAKDWG